MSMSAWICASQRWQDVCRWVWSCHCTVLFVCFDAAVAPSQTFVMLLTAPTYSSLHVLHQCACEHFTQLLSLNLLIFVASNWAITQPRSVVVNWPDFTLMLTDFKLLNSASKNSVFWPRKLERSRSSQIVWQPGIKSMCPCTKAGNANIFGTMRDKVNILMTNFMLSTKVSSKKLFAANW